METGLPTGSIIFLLTLSLLVKLTLSSVTIHYNAGHTYIMQELVKEVTLINNAVSPTIRIHPYFYGFSIAHTDVRKPYLTSIVRDHVPVLR